MCARVGNQRSRGVVTAWVRTDAIQSHHHQHRDLHQSTYPIPLGRLGLILLLVHLGSSSDIANGLSRKDITALPTSHLCAFLWWW
jgi:hypothetical protein